MLQPNPNLRIPQANSSLNRPPVDWQATQHAAKLAYQENLAYNARTNEDQSLDQEVYDDYDDQPFDPEFDTVTGDDEGGEAFGGGYDTATKAFQFLKDRAKAFLVGAIAPPGMGPFLGAGVAAIQWELKDESSEEDES